MHGSNWKKRYFVLKDSSLYRYDVKDGKLLSRIPLDSSVSIAEYRPDQYAFCFELKTRDKSIVLRADSEPEMHEWLNVVQKNKLLGDKNVEKTITFDGTFYK